MTAAKQSKAHDLSTEKREQLTAGWLAESRPAYLVADPVKGALRLYLDLARARNWIKDTGRFIRFNPAAVAKRQAERGSMVVESLVLLALVYVVVVLVLVGWVVENAQ